MSLTWDTPPRWNVSIQIAAPRCHINYLCLCQKFVTLGSRIFWLFSALLFHVVRNLPCQSKGFFCNVGPPLYRSSIKSPFSIWPSVRQSVILIFFSGIALQFSVLKVFLKRAPIFNGYSTFLKIYKILRVISTTALPIPVYVRSAYRK